MKRQNPLRIQTPLTTPHCFEGYYFKHMDETTQQSFAFIVGFSTAPHNSHCFIQVIRSSPLQTHYFTFPLSALSSQDEPFQLTIEDNRFGERGIEVHLHQDEMDIDATLAYGPLTPLQANPIMGPFALLPKMECNHGIVSMHHAVKGVMSFNKSEVVFQDGVGYIEKDWGHSFPSAYVWVHGAWSKPKQSLFFSLASIPYLGITFTGVICNLVLQEREFRFATYKRVKYSLERISDTEMHITLRQGKYTLILQAYCQNAGALKAPHVGAMDHIIKEGLGGTLSFQLYEHHVLLAQDICTMASMELVNVVNLH
ncbi:MAG: tocopherol cyclase family protein [Erysipelotrichaceae bacterium]